MCNLRILCFLGFVCSIIGFALSVDLLDQMIVDRKGMDAFLWGVMVIICLLNGAGCVANLLNIRNDKST